MDTGRTLLKRTCEWCNKPLLVKDTGQERNTHTDHPTYRCRACILERDARYVTETRERLGLTPQT